MTASRRRQFLVMALAVLPHCGPEPGTGLAVQDLRGSTRFSRQPSVVSRQSETTHHSPGSRTPVAHPESRRLAKTNPDGPRREGFLRDHVRKVATPFPAPSPPRSACLLPVHVAGERAGVRGPYRSLRPPHPDPLPPNGVHSESSTDGGGEGADSTDYTQWAKALWRSGEESAADLPRPPLPTGGATFGEDMAVGRGLG